MKSKNIGNTKYNSSFCDLVIEICSAGASVPHFCCDSRVNISEKTYYSWVAKHKEFREAHDKADAYSKKVWLDVGKENLKHKNYNNKLYEIQFNARFHNTRLFLPELKNCKSVDEKFECLFKCLADAQISLEQAEKLSSIIHRYAQCTELDRMGAKIEDMSKKLQEIHEKSGGNFQFSSTTVDSY